jgi:hypothetical protein
MRQLIINQIEPSSSAACPDYTATIGWQSIVDLRDMPREVQEIAFEKGMIPDIPDHRK